MPSGVQQVIDYLLEEWRAQSPSSQAKGELGKVLDMAIFLE
jgi:hypothetical protein